MKRFAFPLEKVLQWRGGQAELERQKLQAVHAELRATDAKRTQAENERDLARQSVRGMVRIDASDLANLDNFQQHIRSRLLQIAQERRKVEIRIEEQQARALHAQRQFELLDRLKQRALAAWEAERNQEEEALAAELFLAKRQRESRTSRI